MEAAVFMGIQGSGKTTFYVREFLHTHVRISQDLLRTRHRVMRFVGVCHETRQQYVVDRVNATADDRREYIERARDAGFRVIAYWFDTPPRDALARNATREGKANIPVAAILGAHKRLEPPRLEEGFHEVYRVGIDEDGQFIVEPLVGVVA